jgi:aspartate/methionine/tyrosine aminotransferase
MLQEAVRPSRRAAGVEYAIRDVVVKAEEVRRTGKKILHLNIGDPVKYDFDTPPNIKQAMKNAVDKGSNYYSTSDGLQELHERSLNREAHSYTNVRSQRLFQSVLDDWVAAWVLVCSGSRW